MSLTVMRALEVKRVVDDQQALQLVLVQQCLGLGGVVPSFSLTVMSFSPGVMIWPP